MLTYGAIFNARGEGTFLTLAREGREGPTTLRRCVVLCSEGRRGDKEDLQVRLLHEERVAQEEGHH